MVLVREVAGRGAPDRRRRSAADTDELAVSGVWGTDAADAPLGRLATPAVRVPAESALPAVDALFRQDAVLQCVVVDALEGPVLLERAWFQAVMTGRMGFGRVMAARRRIGELRPETTLVFPSDTPVSRAAAAVISGSLGAGILNFVVVEHPDGRLGVVAVADVFESLALHYAHQSLHDPLTGLPNRSHLVERLHGAGRLGQDAALLFIDLDRFKDVNDQHGHAAGDQVLTEFAARLLRLARSGDLVARLAGDEFALLTRGATTAENRAALAERVVRAAAEPFVLELDDGRGTHRREVVVVGASVGVAHAEHRTPGSPGAGPVGQLDVLLKHADLAMYRAKSRGRGRHAHFEVDLVEDASSVAARSTERATERRLRLALGTGSPGHRPEAHGLAVHYQPVVELPSGRVLGAEALVRWTDDELGTVGPDVFVPVAESSGLVLDLGLWVLRTACREAVSWTSGGAAAPTVAVNVSPVQLAQRSFVADVTRVLAETGLAAHRLTLEITETAAVDDLAETADLLTQLRALGVQLALDDFGTGHSSLTMLRTLPVHQVKIDRTFVEGVAERAGDAVLVRLVVEAAHGLGMRVCAEGIERPEQARQLVGMGCDEAQGWLFGRPGPATDRLREVLAGRRPEVPDLRGRPGEGPAFSAADELVVVTTAESVVTYVSSSVHAMLGWRPTDFVGASLASYLREEELRSVVGETLPGLHVDGSDVHRVRHRDGTPRWLQTRTQQLRDHVGAPSEVLLVARDVTPAVEASLALRDSEQLFRLAFDDAPTGMAITRLDGSFDRVNTAFAVMLGRTTTELLDLSVAEITHPEDRAADEENLAEVRRGAEVVQDVLKRYLHADGRAVPVRVRAALMDTSDDVPPLLVAHVVAR